MLLGVYYDQCILLAKLLAFDLLRFVLQGQISLLLQVSLDFLPGEGNGKPLQYSCLENSMNSMKRQKDLTLKGELPRSVGAQCATGEQWRNNSRKNEEMESKQNNAQLQISLVMEVKSDAVKSSIA